MGHYLFTTVATILQCVTMAFCMALLMSLLVNEAWTLANLDPCKFGTVSSGTLKLEPWNPVTMETWNLTLETVNLQRWDTGNLKPWNHGTLWPCPVTLQPWNPRICCWVAKVSKQFFLPISNGRRGLPRLFLKCRKNAQKIQMQTIMQNTTLQHRWLANLIFPCSQMGTLSQQDFVSFLLSQLWTKILGNYWALAASATILAHQQTCSWRKTCPTLVTYFNAKIILFFSCVGFHFSCVVRRCK